MTTKKETEYIIFDYSGIEPNSSTVSNPKIIHVYGKEIFTWMEMAKNDSDIKIVVHELGECLLDWS